MPEKVADEPLDEGTLKTIVGGATDEEIDMCDPTPTPTPTPSGGTDPGSDSGN